MNFKTEQEDFWSGEFGNKYIDRNKSEDILSSNLSFFSRVFKNIEKPQSIIEFGANIGFNLKSIKLLFPEINLFAIEINSKAVEELSNVIDSNNIYNGSIIDFKPSEQFDIALIKGVLIHINPDKLDIVYNNLYNSSKKYIIICEYYNPTPIEVTYRGFSNKLFKRDFAGKMLDRYNDLQLIDYGFCYRRDRLFPQDDITWFLLKKDV